MALLVGHTYISLYQPKAIPKRQYQLTHKPHIPANMLHSSVIPFLKGSPCGATIDLDTTLLLLVQHRVVAGTLEEWIASSFLDSSLSRYLLRQLLATLCGFAPVVVIHHPVVASHGGSEVEW